ncbi:MAG: DeoR/GlpR family DNA-binding transcription regulator [Treponema sp.]|nr:DeoR/GlpR family DNA-binding transcription regulator [Treponema sp.]
MQKKIERANQIARILRERNGTSIKELAEELAVSKMTIRRDLEELHQANIVSLVHGAAIYKGEGPPNGQARDYHLILEKAVNNPEKERIGKAAADLVKPGDTIIIDIGTTTEQLARNIPQNSPITVLCFTINVLFEIYKKNVQNLIMGGGYYHVDTQLFESPDSINFIRQTRASKFFISAAGVSSELGLTCINQYEVGVKQACIDSSLQKILLADSQKFGLIRPAFFTSLEKIDMVITDTEISSEWVKIMEDMGITVMMV